MGKVFGSFALIFGVMLLSIPVAVIGNQFQNVYLKDQKENTRQERQRMKEKLKATLIKEEQRIFKLIVELNELEEANGEIEKQIKENQFLYRSLSRDALGLINKIELAEKHNHSDDLAIKRAKLIITLKNKISNGRLKNGNGIHN